MQLRLFTLCDYNRYKFVVQKALTVFPVYFRRALLFNGKNNSISFFVGVSTRPTPRRIHSVSGVHVVRSHNFNADEHCTRLLTIARWSVLENWKKNSISKKSFNLRCCDGHFLSVSLRVSQIQEGYISPAEWRIPDSQIKVIGKDGFCITIEREIAFLSSVIQEMVLEQERDGYKYPNVIRFFDMP